MSFLTEDEESGLTINRMVFHVVGKGLNTPTYLKEFLPPAHEDFFLARIKASLRGNLFIFNKDSNVERILRLIQNTADRDETCFHTQSKQLATDFHERHTRNASKGAFFVFELLSGDEKLYALIKYEDEEVIRYVLRTGSLEEYKPRLERFNESFVKKAEAIQKVALVRLSPAEGGIVTVMDRSKRTHISEYFELFLRVKRVNTEKQLADNLLGILKQVFKDNKTHLPPAIAKDGVSRIYEYLRNKEFEFDTTKPRETLTAIFGQLSDDSPVLADFTKKAKEKGIMGESFTVKPENIEKPKRKKLVTEENVVIYFDDRAEMNRKILPDGRTEITILTAGITVDDIDTDGH